MMQPCVLSIAGSDPTGGAGLQADLKTFARLNVDGRAVPTALTVQTGRRVISVNPVAATLLEEQLEMAVADRQVTTVKIGMLGTKENVEVVAAFLKRHLFVHGVLDTVFRAKDGTPLLEEAGISVMVEKLFPCVSLITPNIDEAAVLAQRAIASVDDMKITAKFLYETYRQDYQTTCAILIKGGHLTGEAVDVLYDGTDLHLFSGTRFEGEAVHGTGCCLSSAIAATLAKGYTMANAVRIGKDFVTGQLFTPKQQGAFVECMG